VFAWDREAPTGLWRVRLPRGKPERVPGGESAKWPSLSRKGGRLAFARFAWDINIWRAAASGAGVPLGGSVPSVFIQSTQTDSNPVYSPDGTKVAFLSDRSGSQEIWLSDSDGSNQRRLTSLNALAWVPKWSPDGRQIVFYLSPQGDDRSHIYTLDVDHGLPQQLTRDIPTARFPHPNWSHDGKWIYFCSAQSGRNEIWKMSAEGGQPAQVTRNGGVRAAASRDGRFLYFTKDSWGIQAIWRIPAEGGEETQVLKTGSQLLWDLSDAGIYWLGSGAGGGLGIQFLSFAAQRSTPSARLSGAPERYFHSMTSGISISPDGRWILYGQLDRDESDIMMVENFR
jgi:dipeptidyl aminopeptidase/acylaminoacyl peptidase